MSKCEFIPKYQKIIDEIRISIANGQMLPGTKLPVRDDLVKAYGVTRSTIDRAMNELLRDGTLIASPRSGTYISDVKPMISDKIAIVLNSSLFMAHKMDWNIARNYYSMYGKLFELIPEDKRDILNLEDVSKNPEILQTYKRILWNNLSQEEFELAVKTVGDRNRFLLLNRYYDNCNFISINHRQAAFDLAEEFLKNLPENTLVGLLDIPYGKHLSNRFVWLERRNGFMDACQKHNRFCRVIELRQNDYQFNQKQFEEFDSRRQASQKALLLSPSSEIVGSILGFVNQNSYKLYREYFYGDFDNDDSLNQYGVNITSIVENFTELSESAFDNIDNQDCHIWCSHTLVNSPFA